MKKAEPTTDAAEEQQTTTSASRPVYMKALAVVGITTGYIFGPMVLFGGIGWLASSRFENKLFLIGGFLIALVVSNILIFRTTEKVLKKM